MRDRLLQATILTLLLQMLALMSSSTTIKTNSIYLQANQTPIPTIIQRLFNLSQVIPMQSQKAQTSFRLPS